MEALHKQILDILLENCRTPLETIAVMTNTTVESVADAISDMEKQQIILLFFHIRS